MAGVWISNFAESIISRPNTADILSAGVYSFSYINTTDSPYLAACVDGQGVYGSTDGGVSWNVVTTIFPHIQWISYNPSSQTYLGYGDRKDSSSPYNSARVWKTSSPIGSWTSIVSWTPNTSSNFPLNVTQSTSNGDIFYAFSPSTFWYSNDQGFSWQSRVSGLAAVHDLVNLHVGSGGLAGKLYLVSSSGTGPIFRVS